MSNQFGQILVLEVENIKQRTLFNFHKELFSKIENPTVLVLLWTTNSEEKKKKYRKAIESYFKDLGAREVLFLEENDPNLEKKFEKANIIYLPGGDTSILLEKLNNNLKVIEKLKEFRGILIGNSAGAIALAKEGYGHKNGKLVKYKGLGIVNIKIIVHFEWKDLVGLGDSNVILLSENSYLIIKV